MEIIINRTCPEGTRRKSGARKGNQNARKHGFYSRVLDAEERCDFEEAVEVEGLDQEIAMLRVKIKSLLRRDPDNMKLITQATRALARLLAARYKIDSKDKQKLFDAVAGVLKGAALPLGMWLGKIIDK
jgi:hypothetical protein